MPQSPEKVPIEEAAQRDYEVKKRLRAKQLAYYAAKMADANLKPIKRFVQYHPDPSRLMKLGVTFAHRDLESTAEAMAEQKPLAAISGLNPSGPLHFGHKQVFDELLWMQKQGADVYIPITNDETYLVGKAESLADARRVAYEEVIPSIIAMGFDPNKTFIYVDSDYPDIYNLAMDVSKHLSLSKVSGVFGIGKEKDNVGTVFYRGAVQLAQMILPQLKEFGGARPSLIPAGVDQYPYVVLARDIAKQRGLIPPAATFSKFGMGLDGKGKMSASRLGSALFLTDDAKAAEKKIKSSYTGGNVLATVQREQGGVPEICPIYQLRTYHFKPDNSLAEECRGGKILCGECKKRAIAEVTPFLEDHQSRADAAKSRIDDFLLKKPITSITKK